MNNIENESTFFVSIEGRKVNQNSNFKNKKQKYFVQSIKITKPNNSKIINSNNTQSNITNLTSLNNLKNKKYVNTIPNLKAQNNIIINKSQLKDNIPKEQTLILPKTNNIDEDLDLNIDDTDEYNNTNFQINIKKPKLPLYNLSYFENKINFEQNPTSNSQIIKSKNYRKKYYENKNKSKSCCFDNRSDEKLNLNKKIATANSKIEMLKNLKNQRNKEILKLQIFFEKNNCHRNVKKDVLKNDLNIIELKKQIFKLKMEKLNREKIYISKKQSTEEINKENLSFANLKTELIEKILDYKILLMESNISNELFTYNDEATIVNDSYIFDKYLNTLEDKLEKENNIIELKNIESKNISLNNVTEEDDSFKVNFKEINNFKNNNTNNYFNSNFIVNAKINTNKNNLKKIIGPNSQFNILIDRNKIK